MVDLYREWKTEEWCDYLYKNIWIFIDMCGKIPHEDRLDIASEAIMEAHKSILKSLNMSYCQIYNYVRIRVIGRIKNYYFKEQRILTNYFETDMLSLESDMIDEINSKICDKTILEFIIQWILWLSAEEKQVIYLRIFNFPWMPLQDIQNISWIDKKILSRKYITAIEKIKKHLIINWIEYESLF